MKKEKRTKKVTTLNIVLEVAEEAVHSALYFAKHNFRHISTIIDLTTPYMMYFLGQYLVVSRGYKAVGYELFIPLALWLISGFVKKIANKTNKGSKIPRPTKRFTEVDEDGIVYIEQDRLEEMIVYMEDLENWMERKGWL